LEGTYYPQKNKKHSNPPSWVLTAYYNKHTYKNTGKNQWAWSAPAFLHIQDRWSKQLSS